MSGFSFDPRSKKSPVSISNIIEIYVNIIDITSGRRTAKEKEFFR